MKKKFLLDTNVLMRTKSAFTKFGDNKVYICHTTLEELDNNKTKLGETGYMAREAIREIHELVKNGRTADIPLPSGGTFSIIPDVITANKGWDCSKPDNIIISTAMASGLILVTSDISMFTKALAVDCKAEIFRHEQVADETLAYSGATDAVVPDDVITAIYADGKLDGGGDEFLMNEYIHLKSDIDERHSALARFDGENIVLLKDRKKYPKGIQPRNLMQKFAIDALLAPVEDVPLVILRGPAGTAKTFLALAAGLQEVEDKKYNKVLILRPNMKFDDDIGFLPGEEMDKIAPLIRPCMDNLEAILAPKVESTEYAKMAVEKVFSQGKVEAEALAYLRGRSIANSYILVDEAQNSTPSQMLGIITRAGEGSKIVITGDPDQIDNPKLDKKNNGLVYASEKMLGSPLCAQIGFKPESCVRSMLAAEAAQRLTKN